MHQPTPDQLQRTISVLSDFCKRIDQEATHLIIQLPNTKQGTHVASQIEGQAREHIECIEAVNTQLKQWRAEMVEPSQPNIADFNANLLVPIYHAPFLKVAFWIKKMRQQSAVLPHSKSY